MGAFTELWEFRVIEWTEPEPVSVLRGILSFLVNMGYHHNMIWPHMDIMIHGTEMSFVMLFETESQDASTLVLFSDGSW